MKSGRFTRACRKCLKKFTTHSSNRRECEACVPKCTRKKPENREFNGFVLTPGKKMPVMALPVPAK